MSPTSTKEKNTMSDESKEEIIKNQLMLAKRAIASGNYEKAEECYGKVLDCDLNHLEAIVGQASAAAHQSSLEQSRFNEMLTAFDTVESLKEEQGEEKCKAAKAQLMEQFVDAMEPLLSDIVSQKGKIAWQKFANSGLAQAGRSAAAAKSMDFKEAFKKVMPEFFKAEVLFFKKFDEKEAVSDPVLKEPYLRLAKLLLSHLTNGFLIKLGQDNIGGPLSPSFPIIVPVLEKTEDPKGFKCFGKFHPYTYGKTLAKRLKPYYPAGTKLPCEGACYVATAVYGSYDCPEVWVLRRYRDNYLATSFWGRAFIRFYYAISPTLVKYFGHTQWFRSFWKGRLDRMVCDLKAQGVSDKPYWD